MKPETVLISGTCPTAWSIASHYAARGASVALFGENPVEPQTAAPDVHWPGQIITLEGKASLYRDAVHAVERTFETFGSITSAVIVPASADTNTNALDDEWGTGMTETLTSVANVTRAVLPHLIRSKGSLVAVTPLSRVRGIFGHSATATAMHGVVGFVRTLALDFGPEGVRSNIVSHGPITRSGAATTELRRIPMGRACGANDVAAVVAHLTSPRASYTNGTVQVVDGGLTAGYLEVTEETFEQEQEDQSLFAAP